MRNFWNFQKNNFPFTVSIEGLLTSNRVIRIELWQRIYIELGQIFGRSRPNFHLGKFCHFSRREKPPTTKSRRDYSKNLRFEYLILKMQIKSENSSNISEILSSSAIFKFRSFYMRNFLAYAFERLIWDLLATWNSNSVICYTYYTFIVLYIMEYLFISEIFSWNWIHFIINIKRISIPFAAWSE